MALKKFQTQSWESVLDQLKHHLLTHEDIGSAIVRLGKPFDCAKILAAKEIVAAYLNDPNNWVRHEALWFLTCWGRLKEYQPALIAALRSDPEADNRSFAATCLGRLQEGTSDRGAVSALKASVEDQSEDELVRLHAYRGLLQVAKGISDTSYTPHDHKLSEIDWQWVRTLS
ncbi:MAG TPA: HEAT repeat domain-containing protein [Terriglobales bacterium]|nr:HEAT repeat domain-containing protein [Terriglobales bacterium]